MDCEHAQLQGLRAFPAKFRVIPFIQDFGPTSEPVGTTVTIKGTSSTGATKLTF